ncbi:hypothetical protein I4F81_004589 [Pyropia yezoensis]|uniref:Uncharacterized protein n=1 Tax=Pyropia yezoensis TaxID=2788 RepID=A0ACC3BVV0_PYRYE|nr:hypothetical protein I4F81_004589 [Neopyropia yezoensis]
MSAVQYRSPPAGTRPNAHPPPPAPPSAPPLGTPLIPARCTAAGWLLTRLGGARPPHPKRPAVGKGASAGTAAHPLSPPQPAVAAATTAAAAATATATDTATATATAIAATRLHPPPPPPPGDAAFGGGDQSRLLSSQHVGNRVALGNRCVQHAAQRRGGGSRGGAGRTPTPPACRLR